MKRPFEFLNAHSQIFLKLHYTQAYIIYYKLKVENSVFSASWIAQQY